MRKLEIFKILLERNNLSHLCNINGFGNGNVFMEYENRNWIVYEEVDGIQVNRQIHLKIEFACMDVLKRITSDWKELYDNFSTLCSVFDKQEGFL